MIAYILFIFYRLSSEIVSFVKYIELSDYESQARSDVVHRIERVVKGLWPLAEVKVFGSFVSNLSLPTSDIDMLITHKSRDIISMIYVLGNALEKDGSFGHIEKITRARVPLIKFRDLATGVSIDVSFNSSNGPRNTEIVKSFIQEYPASRPLTLVIKHFLYHNCLNEPYYGGLGAYGLFLMVVSFLQHHAPNGPENTTDDDLGWLLVEFFKFYGVLFNYCTTGISVRNGGAYFSKILYRWFEPEKPYLLSVEDPEDTENDVTRQAYDIMTIRSLFSEAYSLLTAHMKSRRPRRMSVLSEIVAVHPKLESYRSEIRSHYASVAASDGETAAVDGSNDSNDGKGSQHDRSRDRSSYVRDDYDDDNSDDDDHFSSESEDDAEEGRTTRSYGKGNRRKGRREPRGSKRKLNKSQSNYQAPQNSKRRKH